MMEVLTFGASDLTAYLRGIQVDRPVAPDVELATSEIPGRDGALVTSRRLRPLTITVRAYLKGHTASEVEANRHELARSLLYTDQPRELVLPTEPDRAYMARFSGQSPMARAYGDPQVTLPFFCADPVAFSAIRTAELTAGQQTVAIGGNVPTWVTITCPDGPLTVTSTKGWVTVPSSGFVLIDMETATATAAGNPSYDLGSTFFPLGPGSAWINPSKACTMTWRERWV